MDLNKKIENYFAESKIRNDEYKNSSSLDIKSLIEKEFKEYTIDNQIKLMNYISDSVVKLLHSLDLIDRRSGLILVYYLVDLGINDHGLKLQCLKEINSFVPTADLTLMELNASIFTKFAQINYLTSDMFDYEIKKAKKYLSDDQGDRKIYSLILYRECSKSIPSMIFSYILDCFHTICACVSDPRPVVREISLSLIKNCLAIFVPRENRGTSVIRCYETLYKTASFYIVADSTRIASEDMIIISLTILREIVFICTERAQATLSDITSVFTNTVVLIDKLGSSSSDKTFVQNLNNFESLRIWRIDQESSLISTLNSPGCLSIIGNNYSTLMDFLFKQCDKKNAKIVQLSISIISMLSGLNRTFFSETYLTLYLKTIFVLLVNFKDTGFIYLSMALLFSEFGEEMTSQISKILQFIRKATIQKEMIIKGKSSPVDPMILACLTYMCKYCDENNSNVLHIILENILNNSTLTPAIIMALIRCYKFLKNPQLLINNLIKIILVRILKVNAPSPTAECKTKTDSSTNDEIGEENNQVVLALRAISLLEISDCKIREDLYNSSQNYLASINKLIRLEAAKTCCQIVSCLKFELNDLNFIKREKNYFLNKKLLMLKKLLIFGISDIEPDIRLCVLTLLSEYNDDQLSHDELLKILCLGIRDENTDVRQVVISLLGRLSSRNPSMVIPILDKYLIECITELKYPIPSKDNDLSAKMLCSLVSSNSRTAISCMKPILEFSISKINESGYSNDYLVSLLLTIINLSFYCGEEMNPYTNRILLSIIKILVGTTPPETKEYAIKCIIYIIQYTGYFIENDKNYYDLFEVLLNLIAREQCRTFRRSIIHVLGCIGARDPDKIKFKKVNALELVQINNNDNFVKYWNEKYSTKNVFELLEFYCSEDKIEEFYSGICIDILLQILADNSLSAHHSLVVQVIQDICNFHGNKCSQFISKIFPSYIQVIKTSDADMKKVLFEQIGKLTLLTKSKIHPYVNELFQLIDHVWNPSAPFALQSTIVKLIEYIIGSGPDENSQYLPHIMAKFANILLSDRNIEVLQSDNDQLVTLLLSSIRRMSPFLKDYLFILVPALVKSFDQSTKPVPLQSLSIATIQMMTLSNDMRDFVSLIVQAILRAINSKPQLISPSITLLCTLLEHAPSNMKVFIPIINQTLIKNKINNQQLESLISLVLNSSSKQLEKEAYSKKNQAISNLLQGKKEDIVDSVVKVYTSNADNIIRASQTSQRVSKEDWNDWLNRLTLEMIKESPSPIIRFCSIISQSYSAIGRSLFNFSFYSCWRQLNYVNREKLTSYLTEALQLQDMNEIVIPILNLMEFIQHTQFENCPPIPSQELANCSFRASAFVKSLRYIEESLVDKESIHVLQSLISINILLNNNDAAEGVLVYATKRNMVDLTLQQRWFEKLHDWDNALIAYEKKLKHDPKDMDLILGKMKCLEALCEWDQLDHLVNLNFQDCTKNEQKIQLSRMGSFSSIGLEKWDSLKSYFKFIPKECFEGSLFRAIYHIKSDACEDAKIFLDNARDYLDGELSSVLVESYERGYRSLLTCQMLSELEEMINFKLYPSHQNTIKKTWHKRILKCERVVSDWQRILDLRSIVLKPQENIETWLKLSSISMKAGRFSLCKNIFDKLLTQIEIDQFNKEIIPNIHPLLATNYIKYMWYCGKKLDAFNLLKEFTTNNLVNMTKSDISSNKILEGVNLKQTMAKSYLRLGLWSTDDDINDNNISTSNNYFACAIENNKQYYKAWQAWAKLNYEVALNYKHDNILSGDYYMEENKEGGHNVPGAILSHVVLAVSAFFKSIKFCGKNSFQDTLRLLTLWFEFGEYQQVYDSLINNIKNVKIENWLQVLPQLIARIDTPKHKVRKMIQHLLVKVGNHHPQAFIYPLMVSSKSVNDIRSSVVKEVLNSVSARYPGLVEQAIMISNELIRVSILWSEDWCYVVEEASKLFLNDKNIPSALALIDSMYQKMSVEIKTPIETAFIQSNMNELSLALKYRNNFSISNNIKDLIQAWNIYYEVYKRLSKQINLINSIDLQYASPKLFMCRNLILVIPGSYQPHIKTICIQNINPVLTVIDSKQKPRKLSVRGDDGKTYDFLLKGKEDLRQDERIMQLFGLLNNILINNHETFKRKLEIKRYSVTPISTYSGLIGWVSDCDTLHCLIKEYRNKNKILVKFENILINKNCPQYDQLDPLHKIDLFERLLELTPDTDLAESMWQKSITSEVWFDKRTNFTRSLAVMSMVGYILGLGDRHPSNIMQERTTGKIIHIDFGDCFEVAMKRVSFPEKVPFRLTRMLTKCMEVTGIDGTFKVTSIRVMEVLRENKDSLLAVLEAFIYDPLLNWRLLESKNIEDENYHPLPSEIDQLNLINSDEMPDSSRYLKFPVASDSKSYNSQPEILNKKAVDVIKRVKDKLTGRDFHRDKIVDVKSQVELLIDQATSIENLSQSYMGWCPFW